MPNRPIRRRFQFTHDLLVLLAALALLSIGLPLILAFGAAFLRGFL